MTPSPLLVAQIKSLIVESLRLEGVDAASIADDQALFGGGLGLDSVDALELVVALERRFDIKLDGSDLDRSVFASVASLAAFVEERLGGRSPAPDA